MEFFNKLKTWFEGNKDVAIKAGAGVLGAVLGVLVSGLLSETFAEQEEGDLPEWMLEDQEDEDEDLEDEKE